MAKIDAVPGHILSLLIDALRSMRIRPHASAISDADFISLTTKLSYVPLMSTLVITYTFESW